MSTFIQESMVYVERIWYLSSESNVNTIYRWDAGNELWELENDIIYHYRLISRTFLNELETEMKEVLEPLQETAIPLEICNIYNTARTKWKYKNVTPALIESDTDTTDSWDWTPLQDCIPPSILYRPPSPILEESLEWYVKQENPL